MILTLNDKREISQIIASFTDEDYERINSEVDRLCKRCDPISEMLRSYKYPKPITTLVDEALLDFQTPATDAFLAEVRAKAFDDLCAAFVKHASVSGLDDGYCVTVKEATDALLHCAEQLHKGVHS